MTNFLKPKVTKTLVHSYIDTKDLGLIKQLISENNETNTSLSMSAIVAAAVHFGLPIVEKQLQNYQI